MIKFTKFTKFVNEIRDLAKTITSNDGSRSILESILYPEVALAFDDWKIFNIKNCVLIGGIALSFYVKPRTTQDVDILFIERDDIPDSLNKFKRTRLGAFQHNKTHVEIEVLVPESINTSKELVNKVFDTSINVDGINVASPSGLVALKLGRFNRQDQADIENLLSCCEIDLTCFNLSDELMTKFLSIKNDM